MYYLNWLPMGTDARVRGIPWATMSIFTASVVIWALLHTVSGAEALGYRLAFKAGQSTIQTAIVSLFIHANPVHLIGNLIFLGFVGPPLESRLGPARFLIAYTTCGWLANLAQASWIVAFAPELAMTPLMGASGAVSGLMGLFLVRLNFARLRFSSVTLLFTQGVLKPGRFSLPATAIAGLWIVLQLLGRLPRGTFETAAICHLSGALLGVCLGWSMGLVPAGRLEGRVARGSRYARRGEWFAALGEYEAYLREAPDDPEVVVQVARIQRVTHQDSEAADGFRRAIHLWLYRGETREACNAYEEMKRLLGAVTLPPGELLHVARACEELGRPGDASRAYEAYGRNYPEREGSAVALLKSAEIEDRDLNNPGRARYLYDEILTRSLEPELERVVRDRADRATSRLGQAI